VRAYYCIYYTPLLNSQSQWRSYRLGRPKIDRVTERKVRRLLAKGVGILKVAKSLGIGTGTVQRISGERAMSLRGAEQ
jgi:DNA invertase Pin-like site-specific DNA recombinase